MKALSLKQAQAWCVAHGLRLDGPDGPRFPGENVKGYALTIPKKPYALAPLILCLLDATVDEMDQPSGAEHLLWLCDWSMWSELWTSVGVDLFNHLRLGFGLGDGMDDTPAILFSGAEIRALISFSLVPIVFGWDCYIIPASATRFAFISHDEWIGVSANDEAAETEILSRLSDWDPVACADDRVSGRLLR